MWKYLEIYFIAFFYQFIILIPNIIKLHLFFYNLHILCFIRILKKKIHVEKNIVHLKTVLLSFVTYKSEYRLYQSNTKKVNFL